MLATLRIKTRLILLLVVVGLIPVTVVSLIMLERARTGLSDQAFAHLQTISHTKKLQLERYIERIHADITVLAGSTHLSDAIDAFASTVNDGKIDRVQYNYFESLEYGSSFRKFIEEFGYYDLMLITSGGDIVYSTRQESDLAQNITSGTLAKTLLGKAFQQGLTEITVTDFELYAPSNDQLMAFLLAPVQLQDGETAGAVVLKMPHLQINQIMLERTGMGESGEAYLVGPDHVMRSDSHLDPVHHNVLAALRNPGQGLVETVSTSEALAGRSGKLLQDDYRGIPVLSSYTPVHWGDITYALMAEIDAAEAFGTIIELRQLMIYTIVALFALIL
ncbi:MAG: cache domain-containing protein, partial [Deltaproteobacteria bacterium]|nr:cache domain-containing protein [Deltaproteobacteria bacterium]